MVGSAHEALSHQSQGDGKVDSVLLRDTTPLGGGERREGE